MESYAGRNPVKRWPLASFYLLSLVLASAVVAYFSIWMRGYVQAHGSAFDYVGVLQGFAARSFWRSGNIPVIARAAVEHPILLLILFYAAAPTLAAFIVTAGERGGLRRWLRRLKPWGSAADGQYRGGGPLGFLARSQGHDRPDVNVALVLFGCVLLVHGQVGGHVCRDRLLLQPDWGERDLRDCHSRSRELHGWHHVLPQCGSRARGGHVENRVRIHVGPVPDLEIRSRTRGGRPEGGGSSGELWLSPGGPGGPARMKVPLHHGRTSLHWFPRSGRPYDIPAAWGAVR